MVYSSQNCLDIFKSGPVAVALKVASQVRNTNLRVVASDFIEGADFDEVRWMLESEFVFVSASLQAEFFFY